MDRLDQVKNVLRLIIKDYEESRVSNPAVYNTEFFIDRLKHYKEVLSTVSALERDLVVYEDTK